MLQENLACCTMQKQKSIIFTSFCVFSVDDVYATAERLEKGWKEIQASDKQKMKEVESAQEVTLKILEKRKGDIEAPRPSRKEKKSET